MRTVVKKKQLKTKSPVIWRRFSVAVKCKKMLSFFIGELANVK